MPTRDVLPADEGAHEPGPDPAWQEAWTLDFVADDGSMAGVARLALFPNLRTAWWWSYLLRPDDVVLAVRAHDVALPRRGSLEVRADGLWGELSCLRPLDHWTVGLEAFAVALDDPEDALRGERGALVALGFDLEWESDGPAELVPGGYRQPCRVSGDVLLGSGQAPVTTPLEGRGQRWHHWGPLAAVDLAAPDDGEDDGAAGAVAGYTVPLDPPMRGVHRRSLIREPDGALRWVSPTGERPA